MGLQRDRLADRVETLIRMSDIEAGGNARRVWSRGERLSGRAAAIKQREVPILTDRDFQPASRITDQNF